MATDAQSLISQANCYECFAVNPYTARLMQLALLKQIVLNGNPMADTSPQTLLTNAQCFECYATSPYLLQLMELSLLVQITNNSSAGGSASQIVAYTGANPNADGVKPPNLNASAIAVKPNSPVYTWNIATQLWA